jgi:MSHA biogenesis protein MshJ
VKIPPVLDAAIVRFDRLSLRERLLIFSAVLAAVIAMWHIQFMESLSGEEKRLTQELTELQDSVARMSRATEAVASTDPGSTAMKRLQERQKALDEVNVKLLAESAGLIPPAQMVQVIHDVLKHRQGLTLISLRNLPVTSLAPPVKAAGTSGESAAASSAQPADEEVTSSTTEEGSDEEASTEEIENVAAVAEPEPAADEASVASAGPYLHPVELVIEGRYLDIVAYLRALEGLPWRFYWRVLQLETKTYPLNRVRIELSTVSLDKEWIGV